MRRHTDLFIWIPVLALLALFLAGLIFSFVVPEERPHIDSTGWSGK